jgi:hypothetical protein
MPALSRSTNSAIRESSDAHAATAATISGTTMEALMITLREHFMASSALIAD